MDKVISSRVRESVAQQIEELSKRLGVPKKKVIEEAILAYARQKAKEGDVDVFERTSGAWRRREPAERTVERARKAFRDSMSRHSK